MFFLIYTILLGNHLAQRVVIIQRLALETFVSAYLCSISCLAGCETSHGVAFLRSGHFVLRRWSILSRRQG